jgi:type I restriction-modification system DNA methylase subunit
MSLFQTSVLKNAINLQEVAIVEKAYKKYATYFLNPTIQENIRSSKEEEYQGIFLTELFVHILDYTLKPKADFNLVAEYKNQNNARKADGAILHKDIAIGVIELKGTNTKDLESIRKQAFDYKANQKGCVYVITSNFEKLRFYINDATEFEEFNLFELTKERFQLFYLCLQKDNIINNVPLKIKEASIVQEEQITKEFYKDYSLFKRELYRDLVKNNVKRLKLESSLRGTKQSLEDLSEQQKTEQQQLEKNVKLALFKKSQKLIDRFLFIFFAEDRGLLPANSTELILEKWKADNDFGDERPLYNLFKQYFNFLDQGRKGTKSRGEIYAYNGGLFKEDTLLDGLIIDNELLYKHTHKLAGYDFESQVDVNILGHIFENSLNEIESVNAEIEGANFDKQTSKRKKDGVFYTPKYITKYIVENTVGKLCEEKKTELGIKEEEYFKGRKNRNKATITNLVSLLDTYRTWLLQLTICDPACGSGAFLNQALDFLIKEHTYIDELKTKVLGGGFQFSDIENTILENNIFGVDLNEESVEIAKLSLWLRTAQPRRKLNDLNSNIKCGNSLIDNKAVAGDKAFSWETEFPKVFEKGGFDVVIGNPPYVQLQKMKNISAHLKKCDYKTYESTGDLYCLFYEKGNQILKENGVLGYITSNKWMRAKYGQSLRKYLLDETKPYQLIDLGKDIFEAAVVDSNILLFKKLLNKNPTIPSIDITKEDFLFDFSVDQTNFITISPKGNDIWSISSLKEQDLKNKIEKIGLTLKDWNIKMFRGLTTGYNDAFLIDKSQKDNFIKEYPLLNKLIKPVIKGKEINRYLLSKSEHWILNIHNGYKNVSRVEINNFPIVKEHLDKFNNFLEKRYDKGSTIYNLRNCAYIEDFSKEKIIFSKASKIQAFSYDTSEAINLNTSYFMVGENLKYLLAVLNSKLINYLFLKFYQSGGIQGEITIQAIEKTPIIKPSKLEEEEFIFIVDKILNLSSNSYLIIQKFQTYLQQKFQLEKLSKKLQDWYLLEFGDFIKELNKAIKTTNKERVKNNLQEVPTLTKKDEFEWLDLFEENKQKAQALQTQINQTDNQIDAMVYELYGLTAAEIAIVENT